ncbi:MAG: hypothetical protein QS748_05625 [Candidatus Endonucleobacter bathymodioli]|uniref:Uncharacterized protein n=1 Tax=Candidatus Endonucleibacter bathymodioli TaxID=539814 RepID=A0AA90NLB0_9GAMM|nr:hypothetical protein [Candidatus Endonucleobacter bathymodioli]
MSNNKNEPDKDKKNLFTTTAKWVEGGKRLITPSPMVQTPVKKLAARTIRHYSPETVNIIKNSLNIIKPKIDSTGQIAASNNTYVSAVVAIQTALSRLADTLTLILTEDPDAKDKNSHHDLLANFFQMTDTDNNGIHLVATSNIETLSEDLNLKKNTREYNWLMSHGVNKLKYDILSRISYDMAQLEDDQLDALTCQHERAIELQAIKEKTSL